jgi:hypothetical protein
MKLKDILKVAAPAIIGPMVGGLPFLSSIQNPFVRSALGTGIGSVAFGRKPKDALRDAVIGGLSGGIMEGIAAPGAAQAGASGMNTRPGFTKEAVDSLRSGGGGGAGSGTGRGIMAAVKGKAPNVTEDLTMSGELLKSLNIAGPKDGNLLFKLLNTNLGEGIAAGLVAQLLAEDDEDPSNGGRRPYGAGGPGGQLGGINYMKDGGEPNFYPRRNGGIDPSEGSGTKDDVPALLLAGEFVHTREANEGLGKMMGAKTKDEAARKGIQAQYQLMDAFERMA